MSDDHVEIIDDRGTTKAKVSRSMLRSWEKVAIWVGLTVASFVVAQLLVDSVVWILFRSGIVWRIDDVASSLMLRLAMYVTLLLLLALAIHAHYKHVGLSDFGISRLTQWRDVGLSLGGAVLYAISTMIVQAAAHYIPGFDSTQTQNIGISTHLYGANLFIAFIVLVAFTPLFEEMIFRGFLYGRLRQLPRVSWWAAAAVVSALFGVAHMQWNVGLDVFCLSMVACMLREVTGSIWAGVLLHMLKNLVAFLVTYVFVQGIGW